MKTKLFIVIIVFISIEIHAQQIEDDVYFDPKDTIYLPYFGQNEILYQILDITRSSSLKSSSVGSLNGNFIFHIPVKIWVYHNDDGSNDALSETDIYNLLDGVNIRYANGNTSIQFYLRCGIEHIYSTRFNMNINNDSEFNTMLNTYHESDALNWHLIHSNRDDWGGKSTFPWYTNNFRFAATFAGTLSNSKIITTVHEIGHALGLLHTHENTRGMTNYNGDAANCFQESVSRSRKQKIGCIFSVGEKKCEINGDALCDTEAAPNTSSNNFIDVDDDCNYIGGGTDNWGDAWDPPKRNYMSYISNSTCRNEFTLGQIAVMYINIIYYGGLWQNLPSIRLSGTVYAGENESFTVPQRIEAAGTNTYSINSGATVHLVAGESIVLKPGFSAKAGSTFSAKIDNVSDCSTVLSPKTLQKGGSIATFVSNLTQEDINECMSIITKALNREYVNYGEENDDEIDKDITIHPNPNEGAFTISTNIDPQEITYIRVLSIIGQSIYEQSGLPNNIIQLPSSAKGMFLVEISTTNKKFIKKMVVQ